MHDLSTFTHVHPLNNSHRNIVFSPNSLFHCGRASARALALKGLSQISGPSKWLHIKRFNATAAVAAVAVCLTNDDRRPFGFGIECDFQSERIIFHSFRSVFLVCSQVCDAHRLRALRTRTHARLTNCRQPARLTDRAKCPSSSSWMTCN